MQLLRKGNSMVTSIDESRAYLLRCLFASFHFNQRPELVSHWVRCRWLDVLCRWSARSSPGRLRASPTMAVLQTVVGSDWTVTSLSSQYGGPAKCRVWSERNTELGVLNKPTLFQLMKLLPGRSCGLSYLYSVYNRTLEDEKSSQPSSGSDKALKGSKFSSETLHTQRNILPGREVPSQSHVVPTMHVTNVACWTPQWPLTRAHIPL